MKEDLKEIKPGIGLGVLKFGMSRDEVSKFLGEPDETEVYSITESEEDLTETWHFDELDLSVGFNQEDDWRLVTLCVTSEKYEYKGKKIFGLNQKDLTATLKDITVTDLVVEDCSSDESPNHILISSDEQEINFWLDNDQLTEIQWGPFFEDEDTILWPE